jgi:UDP:flavonoid glycosyltransferase YjiC (YdhE family)
MTYPMVDLLTWQGLGDVVNKFRRHILRIEELSPIWAPSLVQRAKIPYTYCWSPALIPKPKDWGAHIDISGFFFLDLATNFTPPDDLAAFLAAGPPPVYIGFGSIVVKDPAALTALIFEAVKILGIRALVSEYLSPQCNANGQRMGRTWIRYISSGKHIHAWELST